MPDKLETPVSEKTLNESWRDLANSILGKLSSSEDEGSSEETAGVAGAEGNALEPDSDGVEDSAEDAQPTISNEQLFDLMSKVNEQLEARDEQVKALTETVRLLIKAAPVAPEEKAGNSAKASAAANDTSSNPFKNLDLKRR